MTTLLATTLILTPTHTASPSSTPTDHLSRPALLPREPAGVRRAVHPARAVGVEHCVPRLRAAIERVRSSVWRSQERLRVHPTRTTYEERRTRGCGYLRWIARRWQHRNAQLLRILRARPPHYDAWMCIHHGEGSWTDPGSPYYGGLQMDLGFMQAYGLALYRSKGTADHWTPLEQMWVAERAYTTRGFWPWPNTARRCGLL